jgi:hypothetical protein
LDFWYKNMGTVWQPCSDDVRSVLASRIWSRDDALREERKPFFLSLALAQDQAHIGRWGGDPIKSVEGLAEFSGHGLIAAVCVVFVAAEIDVFIVEFQT